MTNEPVSDRLVVVKSQFFDTVDWDIFVTEWLAMFSDANCSELNLWKLKQEEQICAVINSLKAKQVSCALEPCTRSVARLNPAQDPPLILLPFLQDAEAIHAARLKGRRSSSK